MTKTFLVVVRSLGCFNIFIVLIIRFYKQLVINHPNKQQEIRNCKV